METSEAKATGKALQKPGKKLKRDDEKASKAEEKADPKIAKAAMKSPLKIYLHHSDRPCRCQTGGAGPAGSFGPTVETTVSIMASLSDKAECVDSDG